MIKVRVPATSANLGPGFDSLGLALNLYNNFHFEEIPSGIEIIGALDSESHRANLVYTSMLKTFDHLGYKFKGIRIKIETNIPVSRGLGSSASCILGGVMGANKIAGSPLSIEQIFNLATHIEGHPDNIAPALFGGLIASIMEDEDIYYNKISVADGLKFIALVPDFTLSTKDARAVLPRDISYKEAVENVSRVSLLISALSNGRFDLLKHSLKDNLHQPYRGKLIEGFDKVLDQVYQLNALGGYLSGAGPTIMALVDEEDRDFKKAISSFLKSKEYNWQVMELKIESQGAKVL